MSNNQDSSTPPVFTNPRLFGPGSGSGSSNSSGSPSRSSGPHVGASHPPLTPKTKRPKATRTPASSRNSFIPGTSIMSTGSSGISMILETPGAPSVSGSTTSPAAPVTVSSSSTSTAVNSNSSPTLSGTSNKSSKRASSEADDNSSSSSSRKRRVYSHVWQHFSLDGTKGIVIFYFYFYFYFGFFSNLFISNS